MAVTTCSIPNMLPHSHTLITLVMPQRPCLFSGFLQKHLRTLVVCERLSGWGSWWHCFMPMGILVSSVLVPSSKARSP